MTAPTTDYDVIVVGGGNAGFSAAHAAAERGRRVVVLERGEAEMAGGNSFFTAGATRIGHAGLDDLADFIETDERHPRTEVPPYSPEEYLADLNKVTEGRSDPELARVLVTEAQDAVRWLHSLGLRYRLMYERQAYERPGDAGWRHRQCHVQGEAGAAAASERRRTSPLHDRSP